MTTTLPVRITTKAAQRMAVIHTTGDPSVVGPKAVPALYAAAFAAAPGGAIVGSLRARWPDAHLKPKDEWHGIWGLPVDDDVVELPQSDRDFSVVCETWDYGDVAEALHRGSFDTEGETIEALHAAIRAAGYAISGPHEEEYLTPPGAPDQQTIIRYQVRLVDQEPDGTA